MIAKDGQDQEQGSFLKWEDLTAGRFCVVPKCQII